MKRLWLGVALLLAVLGICIGVTVSMDRIHGEIGQKLDLAAEAAGQEDWQQAAALAREARSKWQRHWCLTAMVADHEPMEDAESLFARLEIYGQQQEALEFTAACAELACRTRAISNAHRLTWWNLL